MPDLKPALIFLAKLAVAGAILWLIWDEFDGDQFRFVIERPLLLLLLPATCLLNQALISLRLKLLLDLLGRSVTYRDVLGANMSAAFLGNVLPGSLTADLVKYFYIRQHDPEISHTWLVGVFIFDRMLGLLAMLFWSAGFGLALNMLTDNPYLAGASAGHYWYLPALAMTAIIVAIPVGLAFRQLIRRFSWSRPLMPLIELADRLFASGNLLRLLGIAAVSGVAILSLMGGIALVGSVLHAEQTGASAALAQLFLIPASFITAMIPVAPLGIGVSQLTLAQAYAFFGLDSTVGVSVSTFSQLGMISITLTVGGYFFLRGRRIIQETGNREAAAD